MAVNSASRSGLRGHPAIQATGSGIAIAGNAVATGAASRRHRKWTGIQTAFNAVMA